MELGVMTYEINRKTVHEVFASAKEYGFTRAQFDFYPFCKDAEINVNANLPEDITLELAKEVRQAAATNGITISAVNGFFNMIDRDINVRNDGLYRLENLATMCPTLGCNIINLCTGSRSPLGMWVRDEQNDWAQSWYDCIRVLEQALQMAEYRKVYLCLEVEASNVVSSAAKAEHIMRILQSPWLKIVLDGANLFQKGTNKHENVRDVLNNAFDLLGDDIVLVHGKDVREGENLEFTSAGNGIVDFDYFLMRLKEAGYRGDMILHGAKQEDQIPASVAFMKEKIRLAGI